ncbi:hypothetical protein GIW81_11895 [Hyphomicrobium sp. xq]|uniref:Uncharacterized protein n=1 Tax=Hyphomicrobium album TaxID=2665159 RepID=A0A6I3KL00_9HYPH|nr:hypothetical protein [Hyphomicrobium album]MTD95033.1 hypothetical protein [Hyphomicrobium album]
MPTTEDRRSRRPNPTRYDEEEHALHIKVGEGRGPPYKVSLADLVPRPAPKPPKKPLLIKHTAPPPPPERRGHSAWWWTRVVGIVGAVLIGMCHGVGSHIFEMLVENWR